MLKKSVQQTIDELLNSDDELPDDFVEERELPAYKNDNRFDKINFHWIDSNFSKYYQKEHTKQKVCLSYLYDSLREDNINKTTDCLKIGEKALILRGFLNKQDIFCLQCVEPVTSDATMLWFINFLMYKDLQSNFNFLKSCLVGNLFEKYFSSEDNLNCPERKLHNFDFVIRK